MRRLVIETSYLQDNLEGRFSPFFVKLIFSREIEVSVTTAWAKFRDVSRFVTVKAYLEGRMAF